MLERREFGLRKRQESAPEPAPQTDFDRDRPMYESVRAHMPEVDDLLKRYDEISAHQTMDGVAEDDRIKRRIHERLEEIRKAQS